MMIMMMIVSDLVYILKMIGPKGSPSDDGNDDDWKVHKVQKVPKVLFQTE